MDELEPTALPDAPGDDDDFSAPVISDADVAAIATEMTRILGPADVADAAGEPNKAFWLLPMTTATEFIALLARVPTGSGVAGVQAHVEQYLRERGQWTDELGTQNDAAV